MPCHYMAFHHTFLHDLLKVRLCRRDFQEEFSRARSDFPDICLWLYAMAILYLHGYWGRGLKFPCSHLPVS